MKSQEFAIIVAGGSGTRMKNDIPKQFLNICGLPILMHTIKAFHNYSKVLNIILVLSEKDRDAWKELVTIHNFNIPLQFQSGGNTRFQSVRRGLEKIKTEEGLVAIHDGVRPLINNDIIDRSFKMAALHGSAVPAVQLKESIRKIDQAGTKNVDRSMFRIVQTPQTFNLKLIRNAYNEGEKPFFTDDASVIENIGHKISLFEGNYENIKITTPEDLLIAKCLLKNKLKKRIEQF